MFVPCHSNRGLASQTVPTRVNSEPYILLKQGIDLTLVTLPYPQPNSPIDVKCLLFGYVRTCLVPRPTRMVNINGINELENRTGLAYTVKWVILCLLTALSPWMVATMCLCPCSSFVTKLHERFSILFTVR
jgi:hypothetical protein